MIAAPPLPYVQHNLPRFTEPHVETSYKPKVQKRPGTVGDWTAFVGRLAQLSESLYRDARLLRSKRAEAKAAREGSVAQRDAERDIAAVLKRATEHCRHLALELLSTGMTREHLENHLEQCGTERDHRPSYGIALLYSKLMGLTFEEERTVTLTDEQGQEYQEKKVERKTYCWASQLKAAELEDFLATMHAFSEAMPPLAAKFRRGEVRL